MASLLDRLYAAVSNRRLFFRDGWGDLSAIRDVQIRGYDPGTIREIQIVWEKEHRADGLILRQGCFASPYDGPGLPEESRTAYVQWILPDTAGPDAPVSIHLAATGDEGFARRREAFAKPLARLGVGSMILENPYYGRRRPAGQHSKMLRCVSDLWTMGAATVQEGRSLSRWLREQGHTAQVVCGVSMGGHMAAKVGVLAGHPLGVVAFIAPHSAAAVFAEGLLKRYCAWDALARQSGDGENPLKRMEELLSTTDIRRLSEPVRPCSAFLIGAKNDAYVPPASVEALHRHWPGSTLRWIDSGHVGAFLFFRRHFLDTVLEALQSL